MWVNVEITKMTEKYVRMSDKVECSLLMEGHVIWTAGQD